MKSFRMSCPLTEGIIDRDLCYDVQECIEGNIPVTLEFEDFLEKGNCVRICRECEYNVIANPESVRYGYSSMNKDERKKLVAMVKNMDSYRSWFSEMADREQETYDSLNEEMQNNEEGKKQDQLTNALFMSANYLEDIVTVFNEYLEVDKEK